MRKTTTQKQEEKQNLRKTITELTEQLIKELQEEELTPMDKLALLRVLLPYSVGKLPTALVNYSIYSGQPTSARIVELTDEGGQKNIPPSFR